MEAHQVTHFCYIAAGLAAIVAVYCWLKAAYLNSRPDYPQEVEGMLSRRW